MPAWMVGSVRAESDHMTVEMTMPKLKGSLSPGNEVSVLASRSARFDGCRQSSFIRSASSSTTSLKALAATPSLGVAD